MEKNQILDAIKKVKEISPKRNFKQSFDLIINLKDIDVKKAEQQVNTFVQLHYNRGKKVKVCALVGPELLEQAKKECDNAVSVDDFGKYVDKKQIKKLAGGFDYFIAQATVMTKIASAFGRVFGPKGKMPNPKAGCVVPPNANLKAVVDKLQKLVRLQTKNDPIIMSSIGKEDSKEEEIVDNALTIYNSLIHILPNGKNNVKNAYLKLTMGKPIKIGAKEVKEKQLPKEEPKPEVKEEKPAEPIKKEIKKEEAKEEKKPKEEVKKEGKNSK